MASNQMDTDLEIMFPGRTVMVEGEADREIKVRIKPMPIRHFRDFKKAINDAIDRVSSSPAFTGDTEGFNWSKDMLPVFVDVATDQLLDMINECCEGIDLLSDNCPIWVFPTVVKEWIMESFGSEKKIRPWIDLVEEVLERATGNRPQIWESLRQLSSEEDGESETSENSHSASSVG